MGRTENAFSLLAIVSLVALSLVTSCHGSEHCHYVDGRYVCYFVPYGAREAGEEWEKAWQVCRGNGATLPVISNRTIQALVEKYLSTELPGRETWAAGRAMRSYKWLWLNGREFTNATLLDNHKYLSPVYDTHAIVTDEIKFSGRYPSDNYHSVCEFKGDMCQKSGSISFGESTCLRSVTNEALRWYEARNLCVENGGDLPIFEDPELIERTREVFSLLGNTTAGIWIGLRKTWWMWKRPDSMEEVKYTSWLDHDNNVNMECMLLASSGKKWKQQSCTAAKRFFCQSVKTDLNSAEALKVQTTDVNSEYPHKMSITVGVSIPVIIVIAVASVFMVKKCKLGGSDRPKDRSSVEQQQQQHLTRLNGPNPVTANGHHYTDLRPLDRKSNPVARDAQVRHSATHEQIWIARETVDT